MRRGSPATGRFSTHSTLGPNATAGSRDGQETRRGYSGAFLVVLVIVIAVLAAAAELAWPSGSRTGWLVLVPALLLLLRAHTRRSALAPGPWQWLGISVALLVLSAPVHSSWPLVSHSRLSAVFGGTGPIDGLDVLGAGNSHLTALLIIGVLIALATYPLAFRASLRLLHYRRSAVTPHLESWFDGLASLLALGAIAGALVIPALVARGFTEGQAWCLTVRPALVLVLSAFAVANCQLAGWRTDRRLVKVVAVFVLLLVGESLDLALLLGSTSPGDTSGLPAPTLAALATASRAAAMVLLVAASWRPAPPPTATVELGWAVLSGPISVFTLSMIAGFFRTGQQATSLLTFSLTAGALALIACKLIVLVRTLIALLDSRRLSLSDELTGLPNRRAFFEQLTGLDRDCSTVVMLLDVNGFKGVNDGWGHHVGDLLLRDTADRLTRVVAHHGHVARLGGDEFVVLLANSDPEGAAVLAAAIVSELGPRQVAGHDLPVSVSIGVAVHPGNFRPTTTPRSSQSARSEQRGPYTPHVTNGGPDSSASVLTPLNSTIRRGARNAGVGSEAARARRRGEELLQAADTAMYQAKADGGGFLLTYDCLGGSC